MSVLRLALALLVAGGAAGGPAAAAGSASADRGAHGRGHGDDRVATRVLRIVSPYRDPGGPGSGVDGFRCAGLASPTPTVDQKTCTAYFKGTAVFTGGFVGTQYFNLDSWLEPNGDQAYEGLVHFVATIPGCGSGEFDMWETNGRIRTAEFDPSDQGMPGTNDWRIVPGSATGGLAGRIVSGSGVNHWRYYELEVRGGDIGRGTFTGTVVCRRL
jgi:hypothetical protein